MPTTLLPLTTGTPEMPAPRGQLDHLADGGFRWHGDRIGDDAAFRISSPASLRAPATRSHVLVHNADAPFLLPS